MIPSNNMIDGSIPLKNSRHERFAVNLFQGMTQTDAAIKAGYKPSRAYETASELVRNSKIAQRLQCLQESVALKVKTSKELKLLKLEELFNHEPMPENITARDRVLAISEHNKMIGDYAPEKHAIIGDILIEVVYRDANNTT